MSQAFNHLKSKSVSSLDVVTDKLTTTTVDAKQASFGNLVVAGKPIVASETGTVVSNESTTGDFLVNGNLSVKGDVKNTAGTDLNIGDPLTSGSNFIRPQLPLILQPDGNDPRNIRMQAFKNANNNIQFQLKSVNTVSASDTSSNGGINLFSDVNTETVNTSQSSTNVSYITQLDGGTLIDGDVLVGKATRKDIYAKQLNCATIDTTGEAKLSALSVSGASSAGSLAVSGVSTVGSLNVGSGKFQVDGSGDTQVNGALSVADGKVTTLGGATTVKGTLAVKDASGNVSRVEVDSNGDTQVHGALTVADGKVTTLGGATTVKGILTVQDPSGNTGTMQLTNDRHLKFSGMKLELDPGKAILFGGSTEGIGTSGFSIKEDRNGGRFIIMGNDTLQDSFAPQWTLYQQGRALQYYDGSGNTIISSGNGSGTYSGNFTGLFMNSELVIGDDTQGPGLRFQYKKSEGYSEIRPVHMEYLNGPSVPDGSIKFYTLPETWDSDNYRIQIGGSGESVCVTGNLFVGTGTAPKSIKCSDITFVNNGNKKSIGWDASGNSLLLGDHPILTGSPTSIEQAPSDDRLKHNETDIKNATETLKKIKPYVYDMTETFLPADYKGDLDEKLTPYHKESGFIAQDVEKIPELAHLVTPGDEKTPYRLKYNGFMAFIVQACQEMSTELETVKSAHSDTRAQLETLQKSHTSALSENARLTSQVESLSKVQAELMVRMEALEKTTSSTSA